MRHGIALTLLSLLVSGCATSAAELARVGLGEGEIASLIRESWSQGLAFEGASGTRLVAVRDIACRLSWGSGPGRTDYLCYFTADFEADGRMRSRRLNETIGRNEQGQWVTMVVVTG